ncbi:MAG: hypothetical protein HZB56_13410 [Deltaproteobacteria bacterium]|nr:hypothetical protein [Deltaproteobacteria bacterium]
MRHVLGCAVAALFLFLSGCSTSPAEPRGCSANTECGAGALCREGACTASRAPQARVSEPTGPRLSHTRVRIDGSASSDPDPGDAIGAYAWRARAVSAPCEPVRTSGQDAAFELLAGCAGTFEVALAVRDSAGVESAEAAVQVELFPHPTPPSVSLSASATSLDHRCAGTPLRCAAVEAAGGEAIPLQADAQSPIEGAFTYRWTAEPLAASAIAPRITFTPADAAGPALSITTEGTAIAGRYRVTVEATDPLGVVATAQVEVEVGNRPPVPQAAGALLALAHTFHADPPRYQAEGSVPRVAFIDPDGDPVAAVYAVEESGVSARTMTAAEVGDAMLLQVTVPGAAPGELIGPGVSRTLRLRAEDGNGGAAEVSWAVEVTNRPPRRVGPFATSAAHRFDDAAGQYRATVALADYVDDDGDPLAVSSATGDTVCPALTLVGTQLRAECSAPYSGSPAVGGLTGPHAFLVAVGDPWAALAPESAPVAIGNLSPQLSAPAIATHCGRSSCCETEIESGACLRNNWNCPAMSGAVMVSVAEPEGDPIAASADGTVVHSGTCPGGTCQVPVSYLLPATTECAEVEPTQSMTVVVSDGVASSTLLIPLRH